MSYTKLEIAIILDTCNTELDVLRTARTLRRYLFLDGNLSGISFLRIASLTKISKIL